MKIFLYIILFPLSLIYGFVTYCRNKLYDWKIFKSSSFKLPIIVIGNLNIGGVGKTPHVEYLIRLLSKKHNLATLSRGYKRKTRGFILANNTSTILNIGDEPLQYFNKFKEIQVAVDEKRVNGIRQLLTLPKKVDCIILDDAFQHRAIQAGLNIVITDYNNLYTKDSILPGGRLREWKSGIKRAQIIVVSKCDPQLKEKERNAIISEIKPLPYQQVYFTALKYSEMIPVSTIAKTNNLSKNSFDSALVITGIANPTPFIKKIENEFKNVEHLNFPDHHQFNSNDINSIIKSYRNLTGDNKIIITTEKDYMRLSLPEILTQLNNIPFYYIPIEVYFLGNDKHRFDTQIKEYVTTDSRN